MEKKSVVRRSSVQLRMERKGEIKSVLSKPVCSFPVSEPPQKPFLYSVSLSLLFNHIKPNSKPNKSCDRGLCAGAAVVRKTY